MSDDGPDKTDVHRLAGDAVQLTLVSDTSAPADAREAVRAAGSGLPVEVTERAELAVSEIVTNSVRHGSDPGRHIDLLVERGKARLTVWVRDRGRTSPSLATDGGGFGLGIVRDVADEVAIETGDGWTVRVAFTPRPSVRRRVGS